MISPLLFAAVLAACAVPAAAQVAVSTAVPATVDKAYDPVNPRDPMLPATVFGDQKAAGETQKRDLSKSTFTIEGLVITGILSDSRGREALLRDQNTGQVYVLKGGRLLDSRKKRVQGISGVVKGKQVILMTEDKKVHQLILRDKE
jgi:hypothetical protein